MNKCDFIANYIACYCDNELRKGLKGLLKQDTEARLDAIIGLFCLLKGKDAFIKYYIKYLSIRLINKSFLSQEAEEYMISKLKI